MHWINSLNEIVKPYGDLIDTASTAIIAIFTVVLAWVGWMQIRYGRILRRAYLDARFDGIRSNTAGELVGHVIFKNVGHLPARNLSWVVNLSTGGKDWKPTKIKWAHMTGDSVIPIGAEWPKGSAPLLHPQDDPRGLYLYVWGRVTYRDGFRRLRKRRLDFCHRYPWETKQTPADAGIEIGSEHASYHDRGNYAN
jgi:hypothetical protein